MTIKIEAATRLATTAATDVEGAAAHVQSILKKYKLGLVKVTPVGGDRKDKMDQQLSCECKFLGKPVHFNIMFEMREGSRLFVDFDDVGKLAVENGNAPAADLSISLKQRDIHYLEDAADEILLWAEHTKTAVLEAEQAGKWYTEFAKALTEIQSSMDK